MPSKKKKYNARFPPARIKKIMQTDEEIGKVAAAVPVIISRALELFLESLLRKACHVTQSRNAKTMTTSHLKQCIELEQQFDFLKDLVAAVPDMQGEGEEPHGEGERGPRRRTLRTVTATGRKRRRSPPHPDPPSTSPAPGCPSRRWDPLRSRGGSQGGSPQPPAPPAPPRRRRMKTTIPSAPRPLVFARFPRISTHFEARCHVPVWSYWEHGPRTSWGLGGGTGSTGSPPPPPRAGLRALV
ncbi:dr1-associated corepressor isoform X1 [Mycteria americana]|uniref:dr1-associated corepressor isoform X1 n=1 Tax=Mycteria americana TaxID=33587 RepID=UPI003F589B60